MVSAYIVLRAQNCGAGKRLVARMLGNVLLDTVIGRSSPKRRRRRPRFVDCFQTRHLLEVFLLITDTREQEYSSKP
ncbi:DUF4112 domain-containing protein [Mesorhizobium sophorae]|uniref:DUF4112 domain-containing protein n=1 Tax=Mesorhizobium sophorae TaxID=1300294 RepID=UPI00117E57A2